MKEKANIRQVKQIRVRIEENLTNALKEEGRKHKMSVSSYMNFLLNSLVQKKEVSFEEKINKYERREIKSNVYFTKSEMELLRQHAISNDWSLPKEIRYRIVSSLAKKPKLNQEELKAIYSVRSSLNVLGANINRLIRNDQIIADHNIVICKELLELTKELTQKIGYLEKCCYSNFKLDKLGDN